MKSIAKYLIGGLIGGALVLGILALKNRGGPVSRATNVAERFEAAVSEPLAVAAKNIIAGVKNDRLYLIVNVFPNRHVLESVEPAETNSLLRATARRYSRQYAALEKYAGRTEAKVEYIYLSNFDEYGDADFSDLIRHGFVVLDVAGDGAPGITEDQLSFTRGKVDYDTISVPTGVPDTTRYNRTDPPERDEIYRILREEDDIEVIAAKIRPLYQRWGHTYQGILQRILDEGYSILPFEEFDPERIDEKIVYMRHDIHYRDIIGAAAMMDMERRVGARATYYIQWDYTSFEKSKRQDFKLLKKLAGDDHHFGFHPSSLDSQFYWRAPGDPSERHILGNTVREFVETPEFMKIVESIEFIKDPDAPKISVWPDAELIQNPELARIVRDARALLRKDLASLREHFGEVRTIASHGGALSQIIRQIYPGQPRNWAGYQFGPSWHLLPQAMMGELGILNEPYILGRRYRVSIVTDSSGKLSVWTKSFEQALAANRAALVLVHPALWERNLMMPDAPASDPVTVVDAGTDEPENSAPTPVIRLAGASRQILFDELDFYDHPAYLGDTYPSFSPERVRPLGAEYYLRYDATDGGHHGLYFGELIVRGENGGLLYLPRSVKYEGAVGLSFRYRKTNPDSTMYFRLFKQRNVAGIVHEGESVYFPQATDGAWHVVETPLSEFRFALDQPGAISDDLRNPWTNLTHHQVAEDEIFGIEFGLRNARDGDRLHLDELVILWPDEPSRQLRGTLEPPLAGHTVQINSPTEQFTATTGADGVFEFVVPDNVTRIEVLTQHEGINYLPTAGRYFEIGTHMPDLEIVLRNEVATGFPRKSGAFDYEYSDACAITYAPESYFVFAEHGKAFQEFLTESRSNGFGYLDRDRRVENIDSAYRLVLIGACYVAGQQVDSQDHVGSQVESILRFEGHGPVEAMTAAHNTLVALAAWPVIENHAFKLKPDLIVLNSIGPYEFRFILLDLHARIRGYDPEHPESYHFRLDENGELVHLPHDPEFKLHRLNAPAKQPGDGTNKMAGIDWLHELCRKDPENAPELIKASIRLYREGLKMFVREAAARDIEIALLISTDIGTTWQREGVSPEGIAYDSRRFADLMRDIAREAGAHVLEPTEIIMAKARKPDDTRYHHWRAAGHWSPAGHRYTAEAIADFVRTRRIEDALSSGNSAAKVDPRAN